MKKSALKKKTISSGLWLGTGQAMSVLFGLVGTYFLARRLLPEDFGVIQKVTAFTGMTAILGDLGLSLATIQSKDINEQQLSALFWLNVMLALAIAIVMAACSPLIMWFYGDWRVVYITLIFAGLAFTKGLFVQHSALLKRNLNYKPIVLSGIVGTVCGLASAIFSAPYLGYFALLLQRFVNAIVAGVWVSLATQWRPQFRLRGTGIRPMVKMAGNFTAWNLMGYGIRNIDNVLIGKYWGDAALGLYSKAYSLLLQPLNKVSVPLSQIAVPALSRVQSDGVAFRSFFRRGCTLSMIVQVPLAAFAVIASEELILLILGADWIECNQIFLALAPALLSAATSPATSWIYLSRGDTKRMMKSLLCTGPFYIVCFFAGVPWGAFGVAVAFSITSLAVRIPNIWYAVHPSPVSLRDVLDCITLPLVAASVAGGITWLAIEPLGLAVGASMACKVAVFGCAYLMILLVVPSGRETLGFMLGHLKRVVKARGSEG